MTSKTVQDNLSDYIAGIAGSLDAAVFAGGALLQTRHEALRRAGERGVRMRFLLVNPAVGWVDDLVRPAGIDPRAYAQRLHVNAARALMIGDMVDVRWQPFPIPWWFAVADDARVYLKAINLVGRPPATTITDPLAAGYFRNLFESAWSRAEPAVDAPQPAPSEPFTTPALRVFLCHASEDKPAVRDLYRRLLADGVTPWLDEEQLMPGQDWELEITQALRQSDVTLICLSRQAVEKRGFVQRELRAALKMAEETPRGSIFLVPVRLEPCDVPHDLSHLQWVDLFEPRGYALLSRALRVANQRPGGAANGGSAG